MTKLDQLDKKLISILRSDARTPVVKLAKQLNVSRATIQNRMHLLESRGIILNYTVNLKEQCRNKSNQGLYEHCCGREKSPRRWSVR